MNVKNPPALSHEGGFCFPGLNYFIAELSQSG